MILTDTKPAITAHSAAVIRLRIRKGYIKRRNDWLYDAINLIKPGVMTDEVAKVWPTYKELGANDEYETLALELGHGIGISHWAKAGNLATSCSVEYPELIEENMHFALETYYGEEGNAARIEEQVVVTKDGCRVNY